MGDVEEQLLRRAPAAAARRGGERARGVDVELAVDAVRLARHRVVALGGDVGRTLGAVDRRVGHGGEGVVQSVSGEFPDLQHVEDARLLEHAIVHKILKIPAFAVFEGVVEVADDLAKDLRVSLIAHR